MNRHWSLCAHLCRNGPLQMQTDPGLKALPELFFATFRPWCSVAGEPGLLFLTLLHYCAQCSPTNCCEKSTLASQFCIFSYRVSKNRFVQNITFSWYYWKSMQRFDSRSGIFRFTRNRAKALDDSDVFCDYGTERLLTC